MTASSTHPRLSRTGEWASGPTPRSAAPERIVHIGLGAFHRAHQAWYTAHASDADDWGIVAYGGRSADLARRLEAQGGLYTLITRGPDGDECEVVPSVVRAEAGARVDRLVRDVAARATSVVTLTITESGYRLGADGVPDLAEGAVADDVDLLRRAMASDDLQALAQWPTTPFGRLVLALEARRRAHGVGLAVVSCDNLPDNGHIASSAALGIAAAVAPDLRDWIADRVSFVSTMVDRITPRSTPMDERIVEERLGIVDSAPVVTEPFSEWVLAGTFPQGRPAWESAGAAFVDDVSPFERRKLWMLNGAHTLLALSGPRRGSATVAEAMSDPVIGANVATLWDEAARHLGDGLDSPAYARHLRERFLNPRIEHRLEQIALDSTTKLRARIVPVATRELADGRSAPGCAVAVAAWVATRLEGSDPPVAACDATTDVVREVVGELDEALGAAPFLAHVMNELRGDPVGGYRMTKGTP